MEEVSSQDGTNGVKNISLQDQHIQDSHHDEHATSKECDLE